MHTSVQNKANPFRMLFPNPPFYLVHTTALFQHHPFLLFPIALFKFMLALLLRLPFILGISLFITFFFLFNKNPLMFFCFCDKCVIYCWLVEDDSAKRVSYWMFMLDPIVFYFRNAFVHEFYGFHCAFAFEIGDAFCWVWNWIHCFSLGNIRQLNPLVQLQNCWIQVQGCTWTLHLDPIALKPAYAL